MDRGVWWTTVHGVSRVGHDLATKPHHHHQQTYKKTYSNSNSSIVSYFLHFFFFTVFKIFIWLHWVLVAARRIFLAAACKLAWGMWDLVPWPGIKPEPHVLEGWSLTHWATREVLAHFNPWPIDFNIQSNINGYLLLSHFSRVRLCATP